MSSTSFDTSGPILFGAAYYPEYQRAERTEADFDLMAAAGFNVTRMGESVWSTWEPENGRFDLEWLAPALDAAAARDIGVILGTPTYAIPPWLQRLHPEFAIEKQTGETVGWGGRQEIDFLNDDFRFYAERVITAIMSRYADHPAVIGFQVDNEPGLHLINNESARRRFVQSLQARYGSVERLNSEWGLVYWSHRLSSWDELWPARGNTIPQYDLEWRRFQAQAAADYVAWQAAIVRQYAGPEQFVTTCIASGLPASDDVRIAGGMDITAGNPYYGMQDHLDARLDLTPDPDWSTSGPWGVLQQADRLFSSRQERFLVTETNAGSIGGSWTNLPPFRGQLTQSALALISRGAAMIEYWQWNSLPFGAETYWMGVLPHSLRPGRLYEEICDLGARLKRLGGALSGYVPDYDVTIIYSHDSKWAMEFQPPFQAGGLPVQESYGEIFGSMYRGALDAGLQVRIMHPAQFIESGDPQAAARDHPVLFLPGLLVSSDEFSSFLRQYVEAGGHLVLGIRSLYSDDLARPREAVAPPGFADLAGVSYEEFWGLRTPMPVRTSKALTAGTGHATRWIDRLQPSTAEVLAWASHPSEGEFSVVTTSSCAQGRVTTVGTVPDRVLAAGIARWACESSVSQEWVTDETTYVQSGSTAAGRRLWFVFNWTPHTATCRYPGVLTDAISGHNHSPQDDIAVEPWGVRVFVST